MKCLLCYKKLKEHEVDYHQKCVAKVFGLKQMPSIAIDEKKLELYAKELVQANSAITGVQPKLSLWLAESKKSLRFTLVDTKSNYIIKPQSETYTTLPENEDLCMHLAKTFGLETATHGLIRLPSGKLAYITKRFDRVGESKLHCEDMCQLSESLTEHKYRGSYEKTGKVIQSYSSQSGLDLLQYFQLVLVSFITGNADMHLKNFSMLEKEDGAFGLSPAYDLVSTALVIKNEPEQMSLSLNGKRNKITKKDFNAFAANIGLTEKQVLNFYESLQRQRDTAFWWIDHSFIPKEQKVLFKDLLGRRIKLFCS